MLQNFYTTFILWVILVVLIVLLLRYVSERIDKKFEEKEKLTDIYLDSVFNRINTASTAEALLLLNTEMFQSFNKYTYSEETVKRYDILKGYLVGRAQALKGKNIQFEEILF